MTGLTLEFLLELLLGRTQKAIWERRRSADFGKKSLKPKMSS